MWSTKYELKEKNIKSSKKVYWFSNTEIDLKFIQIKIVFARGVNFQKL